MILNEYELAETIIEKNQIQKREDLVVVAKYLRQEMKCDVLETYAVLNSILGNSINNYNPLDYASYLENLSIRAAQHPLRMVDNVKVSKSELDIISKIENSKQRRLLFTLLVYAKFHNTLSENNNDWCNVKICDLYRAARVSTRNAKEKALFLCKLNNQGYIDFSKKNVNHNIKCLIVDKQSSDPVLIITDMRELGYQYLNHYDSSQFCKCSKCKKIIKKSGQNDYSTKYCNECKQTIKNEQNLNHFQKLDEAYPFLAQ